MDFNTTNRTKAKPAIPVAALPGRPELDRELARLRGHGCRAHFLCYDIITLRRVNYACGRAAGDALVQAVANWAIRLPGAVLYRVESDTFCLLFPVAGFEEALRCARLFERRFNSRWDLETESGPQNFYASVALTLIADDERYWDRNMTDLVALALDMSRSSRRLVLFSPEMDTAARKHSIMQLDLKASILDGMEGFSVHYQPITDPGHHTWRGLEALCRWQRPDIGPVSPAVFIPEAEEMGLIHLLGAWVLERALCTCKRLGLDALEDFFVSVNVSAIQMNRLDFADMVLNALKHCDYPAGKLVLEITESTQFTFNEVTTRAVERLRAQGVAFALDDFGTGYSSFGNLKKLPVDFLKTEQDFILDIENDNYLQFFYYVMSESAHMNKKRIIAEGVETPQQLASVVKNGADLIQGYLFGKPMGERELETKLSNFTTELDTFHCCGEGRLDFKQWLHSRGAYQITPVLFELLNRCMTLVMDDDSLDTAVDQVLALTGAHFRVNRAFVFLQEQGTLFSNRYEWCAEGIESQREIFQRVDISADDFYTLLKENRLVVAATRGELPQDMVERLEKSGQAHSIQSLLVLPMNRHGETIGFVGFDDDKSRDWTPEEVIMLHNVCLLILMVLERDEWGCEERLRYSG